MWGRRTGLQNGDRSGHDRRSRREEAAATPNPWVTAASAPADAAPIAEPDADAPPVPPAALGPQPGVGVPARRLARVTRPETAARVWWVGVHGGAGESTLARLMPGSCAAGHAWPVESAAAAPLPVVLVARTHASGLRAVQAAATEWAAGKVAVRLLGLVLIADAPGRRPRALRDLERLVAGGVPKTWQIPWHEPWRVGDPVERATAPGPVRKLLEDLEQLVDTAHSLRVHDDHAGAQGQPADATPWKGEASA